MATFITELNDTTEIVLETETSGAFSKSELEVEASPVKAFQNAAKTIGMVSATMTRLVRENAGPIAGESQVVFGIKIDSNGSVMIASAVAESQFNVSLKILLPPGD